MSPNTWPSGPDAPLQLEREAGVATLRFNRPQSLNAVDVPMAQALLRAAQTLAADRSVRAIILCGAGKAFMAGGDLTTLRADPLQGAADLLAPLNAALMVFAAMDAPLIAQVHGVAAGAGMSLMLQADFVFAAEGTRFNLAYVNLGTTCDVGASWALPRLVGLRRALEIAMLGETLSSADAQRLGLVNRVLAVSELESAVSAFAQRLAKGPTVALGHLRRLLRGSFERDLATQLATEAATFAECAVTKDFKAGIEAFFTKKPVQFIGR